MTQKKKTEPKKPIKKTVKKVVKKPAKKKPASKTTINAREKKAELLLLSMRKAIKSTSGNISEACDQLDISRRTFYNYLEKYPDFQLYFNELDEAEIDFVEGQLQKQIKAGSSVATIFYLKTKGSKRGYIEKTEVTNVNKNFDVSGLTGQEIEDLIEKFDE